MESSKTFFENIAADWTENHCENSSKHLPRIFRERIPSLQSPVLDAGSGTGILISFLQDKMDGKKCIIEYDIALNMLKQAKAAHVPFRDVFYAEGDGHDLCFADNSFATVFCFQFIPHLEDKTKALHEFFRVLLPGGRFFVLHLMNHHALNHLHQQADAPLRRHKMPPAVQLAEMIEKTGMLVEQYEENEGLYFIRALKQ